MAARSINNQLCSDIQRVDVTLPSIKRRAVHADK
jgi:hypothetical protein